MSLADSVVKSSGGTGSALGSYTEVASIVAGLIVNFAFASSLKEDQKKFEKEIAKLDEKKQKELLYKIQNLQTELERQKIVYQYVSKAKIDELKEKTKKERFYIYGALGLGLLIYALLIFKLKKR